MTYIRAPHRRSNGRKTESFWAMVTPEEKALLKRAAQRAGVGVSEYVITPALERAEEALKGNGIDG